MPTILKRWVKTAPESGISGRSPQNPTGCRSGSSPYNMIQGVRAYPTSAGCSTARPITVASYENGDPRREATVIYELETLPDGVTESAHNADAGNARYNQKAGRPDTRVCRTAGNIRIIRYSDISAVAGEVLMKTETRPCADLPQSGAQRARHQPDYPA